MALKINRKSAEIMAALANAPIYKKQGRVNARTAVTGEMITTTLGSGAKETVNRANVGDWVVTNLGGEQYIIPEKKFLDRYEESVVPGVYHARGYCRAILNPFGVPIEIMASWGSPQTGDEKCLIADVCNIGGKLEGEPYIIEAEAFVKTYKSVES